MLIHNKIRMEFLELLKREINGIVRFQNGRLFNADLERECPAVAVYIDEIEFEPITACNNAFNSILNVEVYVKPSAGEDGADEIAQSISDAISNANFNSIDDISLTAYAYLHDEDQAAWVGARLQYSISYSD